MRPWRPTTSTTRVVVFPTPLIAVGSVVKMRVAGEYREWTFGSSMSHYLRGVLGACPAPRVLDMRIDVRGHRPEFVLRVVQVQPAAR